MRPTTDLLRQRLKGRHLGILDRCLNPAHPSFHRYGGRGISISDEFLDFDTFYAYVLSLPGIDDPSLSFDRIDNDKGYERGNLRMATAKQQANNTRTTPSAKIVLPGVELYGYRVLEGERTYKKDQIVQVECRCLTCDSVQWKDRHKLMHNRAKQCMTCYNARQHSAALERRAQQALNLKLLAKKRGRPIGAKNKPKTTDLKTRYVTLKVMRINI